jgi:hypothetical protein
MKLLTILAFTLFTTSSAHATDAQMLRQIQNFQQFFDGFNGGIRRGEEGFMPSLPTPDNHGFMPKFGEKGMVVPQIDASPLQNNWGPYKDAFAGRSECQVIDLVFVQQPTEAQAIKELDTCLAAVAKAYGVPLSASSKTKELSIHVIGAIPSGNRVGQDIGHALTLRDGKLFGYTVKISRQPAADRPQAMSSLQFSVDRCPQLANADSDGAIVQALNDCLAKERNLDVTGISPDPEDSSILIVYTKAAAEKAFDMNGVVSVDGLGRRFLIQTRPEIRPVKFFTRAD